MGEGPRLFKGNTCGFCKSWIKCSAVKLPCIFVFQYYAFTSDSELSAHDAFASYHNVAFHATLGKKAAL